MSTSAPAPLARALSSAARFGVLCSRGVTRVSGPDARSFLQALVTADLRAPTGGGAGVADERNELRYSNFLNGRGRVEFEALLHCRTGADEDAVAFDIDVEKREVGRLCRHLKLYALRAKVAIDDVSEEVDVWAACGAVESDSSGGPGSSAMPFMREDPRLPGLGLRGIAPRVDVGSRADDQMMDATQHGVATVLGVPTGSDFLGSTRLPLEMGLEKLHGVSFDKGCYLGQELTARTFHTGTLRKHVVPFVVGNGSGSGGLADADREQVSAMVRQYRQSANRSGEAALNFAEAVLGRGRGVESAVSVGAQLLVEGKKRPVGVVTSVVEGGAAGLAVVKMEDAFPTDRPAGSGDVGRWMQVEGSAMPLLPWLPSYFHR